MLKSKTETMKSLTFWIPRSHENRLPPFLKLVPDNTNPHPKTWPKGMKQAPFIEIIFPVFVEPQKCPSISIPKKLDFQSKKQISGRTFPAKKF